MKNQKFSRFLMLITVLVLVFSAAWTPAAAQNDSGVTRIRFARGATSASVSGSLSGSSSARYVLRILAGQLMDVTLIAPEGVSLKATNANGRALTPIEGTRGSTSFRGYVPYNGDYYLTITSGSKSGSFTLNVVVPVRVSFASGATSAQYEGHLDAHQGLDYILRASKGQVLEINAEPETEGGLLQLVIYGADGTVLRSGMGVGSSWRGELPSSQDYIVTVRAGESATDFAMDVIIPQRISFNPGAYSGSVRTRLAKDHTQYYVLSAGKNQRMQVEISPDDHLELVVYGVDGTVLSGGNNLGNSFDGILPSTQDYILAVKNTGQKLTYALTVTIR